MSVVIDGRMVQAGFTKGPEGDWFVKVPVQFPELSVGEVIDVQTRLKGVLRVRITSQGFVETKGVFLSRLYSFAHLNEENKENAAHEENKPADAADVKPAQPLNGVQVRRGDVLERTINGIVKKVDSVLQTAVVVWDKVPKVDTLNVGEIVDGTIVRDVQDADQNQPVQNTDPAVAAENVRLQDELDKAKRQLADANVLKVVVENAKTEEVRVIEGLFHAQFKKIVQLVEAREEFLLWGPTGCGKSHVCKQVADTLGMRFAFVSCTAGMSEGILGGRLLPVGENGSFEYVISEFVDCYENGGLFLLDEIDAADSNVLLLINAALANGKMAISNRPGKPYAIRHSDFVCCAAANTVGTGADRMYAGRNKLDTSTLERFAIGKILMSYDERVEAILCPNDTLRDKLLGYRKRIMEHRLERAMSTRFMQKAFKMIDKAGWTMLDVDTAFFSGWREDEIAKVKF